MTNKPASEKMRIIHDTKRPMLTDYIEELFDDFIELHGDRAFADDGAILAGIGWISGHPATIIAQEKGVNLADRVARNFGCPQPEGYRKSLRLMREAEKFGRPILCLVDTQGAFCGTEAEERGQGNAIADNLVAMAGLRVPVVSVLLGEGGSGGALALAVGNRVAMQEHAVYSVLSPEGFASILWKDRTRAPEAAEAMQMDAASVLAGGIIDAVISEGEGPAHENPEAAIAAVREALTRTLANELADEFLAVYNANKLDSYRVEHADIGKRALRNTCLRYLAFAEPTLGDKLVATQYHQADNMTDALAALSAAVAAELPCRDALMQEYDDKWHQDGLVMDKWFILQSTSPAANVVETVRGLLNHRSFSMSNPNRVRSLIGAFASSNPAAFHAEDGSGYQFLVEMLTELNQRNPQVASRLIEPLIRLKRYDEKRQALMRAALEQLKGLENLSGDLFEKISKALA